MILRNLEGEKEKTKSNKQSLKISKQENPPPQNSQSLETGFVIL